jgi:hypothetical protein
MLFLTDHFTVIGGQRKRNVASDVARPSRWPASGHRKST